jgi:acyl-CoA synthetase (AMP-forming)/AMP-acid ligase II
MSTWVSMVVASQAESPRALIAGEQVWSGRDLLRRASGCVDWLAARVPDGTVIPALLETSGDALALTLAGAAASRPLAPLGTRFTIRELASCVERLESPVVLCAPEFAELGRNVAAATGRSPLVTADLPDSEVPIPSPAPSDIAFVLHTSGTTGAPKAVPYRHDRFARRIAINAELLALAPGAVFATGSPYHHIAAIGNIAVSAAVGAAVVAMPRFTAEAWRALDPLGVTHALAVPTMVEMLMRERALRLPSLQVLQYGAAPMPPDTLRRAMKELPGVEFVTLFGQTEGTPITCLSFDDHCRAAAGAEYLLQSVGRAVTGLELRIDDADGNGVGEVVARADHLFLPGPDGWLHTGDLGRLDVEGYLYLVGRRGDKIIRGGENIYPLEIENVLSEHPGVVEAAVVGVPDELYGETVMAFVVPTDPGAPPAAEVLRAFARRSLAGFKVPTEWIYVSALPRNSNGKLLRGELAASHG